jgi:hypothetical protein
MHAVRSDHHVRARTCAVGEVELDATLFRIESHELHADMQHRVWHDREECAVQIGAMQEQVGCAVAVLDGAAELQRARDLAGVPVPAQCDVRLKPGCANAVLDAEAPQHFHRVRRHLNPGTDASEARRLLVDVQLVSFAREQRRDRKSADACTDDGDFHRAIPG